MKPQEPPKTEAEWRARFAALQNVPEPNLARGRARLLAATRVADAAVPKRATFALALAVGLSVMLVMLVMSTALGALSITSAVLTDAAISESRTVGPLVVPANALSPKSNQSVTLRAPLTPVPGVVPEPPRSPSSLSTQTLAP